MGLKLNWIWCGYCQLCLEWTPWTMILVILESPDWKSAACLLLEKRSPVYDLLQAAQGEGPWGPHPPDSSNSCPSNVWTCWHLQRAHQFLAPIRWTDHGIGKGTADSEVPAFWWSGFSGRLQKAFGNKLVKSQQLWVVLNFPTLREAWWKMNYISENVPEKSVFCGENWPREGFQHGFSPKVHSRAHLGNSGLPWPGVRLKHAVGVSGVSSPPLASWKCEIHGSWFSGEPRKGSMMHACPDSGCTVWEYFSYLG